jgi:parvulin-like peptidyl-prolyl isomerase
MDVRRSLAWVVAALVAVVGCGVDDGVAARVGDREIQIDEIQIYIGDVTGLSWPAVDGRAAERLLDQYLDQEVMVAAAGEWGGVMAPSDPALRTATVRALATAVCGLPPEPSAQEIERVVSGRLTEVRPAAIRVRQMLLASRAAALSASERLAAGEPFVDLSREVSLAPNADTGGDMGLLSRGTLPEELDTVVFGLAEGEISGPVISPAGFHLFQVLEVVPEGPADRVEIERAVTRELSDQLTREFTRSCVVSTAERVGVTVFSDNLWFEYGGRYGESIHDG